MTYVTYFGFWFEIPLLRMHSQLKSLTNQSFTKPTTLPMPPNHIQNARSRSWCYTLNNYTDAVLDHLSAVTSTYHCYGLESAPTTGTKHVQGYIHFENCKSFNSVKRILGSSPHLERAKGSAADNRKYCSKDGDFHEFGTIPAQGRRNDLTRLKSELVGHNSLRGVLANDYNLQCVRYAEKWLTYNELPRSLTPEQRDVTWIYGPTGTGKSRWAFDCTDTNDTYVACGTAQWWDGYDGQSCVILDDFRGSFCKFSILLKILDLYAYRVQIKGGFRQLRASRFIITSSKLPHECYESVTDDSMDQLYRRITLVLHKPTLESNAISCKDTCRTVTQFTDQSQYK